MMETRGHRSTNWAGNFQRLARRARNALDYVALHSEVNAKALIYRLRQQTTRDLAKRQQYRQRELWYRGIVNELDWWNRYLVSDPEGRQWQIESQDRERAVLDPFVARHLATYPLEKVRIIDVGSGPITKIGYTFPEKTLEIVLVDPLADRYVQMLKQNEIRLPFYPLRCDGERLLNRFAAGSFDFAYACNSLDHSYDPLLITGNMVALVRTGGFVLLRHFRNEGKVGAYDGLHQWNFDIRDDRFIIWNEEITVDVASALQGCVEVKCFVEEAGIFDDWNDAVLISMRKLV